ncbi:uncharacterized protein LOC128966433 [Oppia nitens]|uniref:uncharacterized protein LOC128966433 n=1 Tax=Oppia nitens TaxID=1686743 RepID=UPI0023DC6250|nr:uncharacterized protein LOC128966433 [Oppia nitens]
MIEKQFLREKNKCFESVCLRINRFEVPPAVAKGQSVLLHCNFDMEGDELYSVKYYKDYVEFYRYLPLEEPRPGQRFKLRGAYVDVMRSNSTHAFLTYTDLHSDGMYACEISTEGPSYRTVRSEQLLKVYVLPKESLRIEGSELSYDLNDKINLSCKSGYARPHATLHWLINDHMAQPHQLIEYPIETNKDGLQRSQLGLLMYATPNFFNRGQLALRCTTTLTLVYEFEAVEYVIAGSARNKSHRSSYSWRKDWSIQPNRETPIIKGVKQSYNVNEVLNVNCTTNAVEAQLKWYVMNVEVNETNLIRYINKESGALILGLRIQMERKHFQIEELKLRCVSIFHRNIAEFHENLIIRTYNQEILEAQSSNVESNSHFIYLAQYGTYSGLIYLIKILVILYFNQFYISFCYV